LEAQELQFSEKVKQLMKVYLPGLDISADKDVNDVYRHDDFFHDEYSIEQEMMKDVESYLSENLYDAIQPSYGDRTSQKIEQEILDRITSIRERIKNHYRDREDKARSFMNEVDSYGQEMNGDNEEAKEIRKKIISKMTKQFENDFGTGDSNQKEDVASRVEQIKSELIPYLQNVMNMLNISDMMRNIMDIIEEYALKADRVNTIVQDCLEEIRKNETKEKQPDGFEVKQPQEFVFDEYQSANNISITPTEQEFDFFDKLGVSPYDLRVAMLEQEANPDNIEKKIGPEYLNINACKIVLTNPDREVYISDSVMKKMKQEQVISVFEDEKTLLEMQARTKAGELASPEHFAFYERTNEKDGSGIYMIVSKENAKQLDKYTDWGKYRVGMDKEQEKETLNQEKDLNIQEKNVDDDIGLLF